MKVKVKLKSLEKTIYCALYIVRNVIFYIFCLAYSVIKLIFIPSVYEVTSHEQKRIV